MFLEPALYGYWNYLSTIVVALVPLTIRRRWSRDEKAVWKEEESYWRFLESRDMDSYLKLFHEQFVSWPYESPRPSDKPAVRQMIEDLKRSYRLVTYELNPLAIKVIGDIAVVYYSVRYMVETQGEQIEDVRRVSHTWIRDDGEWKILGGMSATSGTAPGGQSAP